MARNNLKQILWSEHKGNPILRAPFLTPLLADPTFLTPDESPDKLWHLFTHSIFGTHHYISPDGLKWKNTLRTFFLSIRPFIHVENGIYYLITEKLSKIFRFPLYDSHVEMRTSKDLWTWSEPKKIVKPDLLWQKTAIGGCICGTSVVKVKNKYHLFTSGGLRKVIDTFFCEPSKTGVAVADKIDGPYTHKKKPLDENLNPNNLVTINRVKKHLDGFFTLLQTYYYQDKQKRSRAATRLLTSQDFKKWELVTNRLLSPTKGWKRSHAYVGDIKKYQGKYWVFFNARDGWNWGAERLGLMIGTPKK